MMHPTGSAQRRARVAVVALVALATLVAGGPVASGPAGASEPPAEAGDPEIVGGEPVGSVTDYPYQVALVRHGVSNGLAAQFCGGSLIAPDTVLTAAHCMEGMSAADIDVRSGILDLVDDVGHRSRVRQIRVHPGYDNRTTDNDLAVLQLVTALPEAPVAIAQPGQSSLWPAGTLATITGWGDLTGDQDLPSELHEVEVPLVADADCADAYGDEFVAGHMLCAGDLEAGGVDSCQGDSGGPIVVDNGGEPLQIGVTSFGEGCGLAEFPGVYARLDTYFDSFLEPYLDPDEPPGAPRRVESGSFFGVARVTWRPPFFDGGAAITGYKLRFLPGGRVVNVGPTARSVDVTGLRRGTTHTVKIKARNVLGLGTVATDTFRIP